VEGFAHGVVKNRAAMDEIYEELNYKLACSLCESHHTAERGIELHKKHIEMGERYFSFLALNTRWYQHGFIIVVQLNISCQLIHCHQ